VVIIHEAEVVHSLLVLGGSSFLLSRLGVGVLLVVFFDDRFLYGLEHVSVLGLIASVVPSLQNPKRCN
jgi:hypothetical protein